MRGKTHSDFRMHEGRALLRLANEYHTLQEVVLEAMQNAIDARAKNIWVTISTKSRAIMIRDDGEGVDQEMFEHALTSVAKSIKEKDKLGQFGLGLISPIGKCESFMFTSNRKDTDRYLQWVFVSADLINQEIITGIPLTQRKDLEFEGLGTKRTKGIEWRTEVHIQKYTSDRIISKVTLESLCAEALARYGQLMFRQGIQMHVRVVSPSADEGKTIRGSAFTGEPIDEMVVDDKKAGTTIFRLFTARKGPKGRKGIVHVGLVDNDFRMSWSTFAKTVDSEWLKADIVQALGSGTLEGEILATKPELHINRKAFEVNDALLGFLAAIETWYVDVGHKFLERVDTESRDARYQELGRRSMQVLEGLIGEMCFEPLRTLIRGFRVGTIGIGHSPVGKKLILGEQEVTAIATTGKHEGSTGTTCGGPGGSSSSGGTAKPKEHEGHMPFTVVGPAGEKRRLVRGDSVGLQFSYEEMPGSDKVAELDVKSGTLRFNIRHPAWVVVEDNDKSLMRFQEYVAVHVLMSHTLPDDWRATSEKAFGEMVQPYATVLLEGDALAGRPGADKKSRVVKTKSAKRLDKASGN